VAVSQNVQTAKDLIMQEFNYYYNGVRHTSVDDKYLDELLKDNDNAEEVKDGILRSYEQYNQ